jgi:hypothetical protein
MLKFQRFLHIKTLRCARIRKSRANGVEFATLSAFKVCNVANVRQKGCRRRAESIGARNAHFMSCAKIDRMGTRETDKTRANDVRSRRNNKVGIRQGRAEQTADE